MLVHAKNPRGILHLDRFRIHGRETGRAPSDIPFNLYKHCKDGLQDATYREATLSNLFKVQFPVIAFTYSGVRWLADKTIDHIGPLMVSDYDESWSRKKKVDQIKISLREKSPCL